MTDKHPAPNPKDATHKKNDPKIKTGAQNDHDKDQEQMRQTGISNRETTKDPNDDIQDLAHGNKTPTAP